MDDVLLARSQMAMSLAFHIVFAAVGIAMPLLMVLSEVRWLQTRDPEYLDLLRRLDGLELHGARARDRRLAERDAGAVHRVEVVEHRAQAVGQRLVGGVLAGEQRVATDRRHLDSVQHGAHRRGVEERQIGVPGAAERAPGIVGLAHHGHDLGMRLEAAGVGMQVGRAEARCEGFELERARLIREARAIYDSIFPPAAPDRAPQDNEESVKA